MPKTLRPSAKAFKNAGWLPVSKAVYDEWMRELTSRIRDPRYRAETALLPPVQAFKEFIETVPTVYEEFVRMFEGITEAVRVFCNLFGPQFLPP